MVRRYKKETPIKWVLCLLIIAFTANASAQNYPKRGQGTYSSRPMRSSGQSDLGEAIVKGVGNLFKKKDKNKKKTEVNSTSREEEKQSPANKKTVEDSTLSTNTKEKSQSLTNEAAIDGAAFVKATQKEITDKNERIKSEAEKIRLQWVKMSESVLFDYNIIVGKPIQQHRDDADFIVPFIICCKTNDNFHDVFEGEGQSTSIGLPIELLLKFKIVDNFGEYPFYTYNCSERIESGDNQYWSVVGITPSWWPTDKSRSGTDKWLRINTPQRTIDEFHYLGNNGIDNFDGINIYTSNKVILYGKINGKFSNVYTKTRYWNQQKSTKECLYEDLISTVNVQDYNVLLCGKMRYTEQQLSQLSKLSVLPVDALREGKEICATKYFYDGKSYMKYDVYDDEMDCLTRGYNIIWRELPQSIVEKIKKMNGTDKQEDALYCGIYQVTDRKDNQVFFKLSTSANGDRTVRIKYVFKNGKTPNNNGIEYSYWGKWTVEELGGKKVVSLWKDKEKDILKPLWISFYGIGAMEEHSTLYMRFLNKTNIKLFINDDDKTSLDMLKISENTENSMADETRENQILQQNEQKIQQQRIEKANSIADGKRKAVGEYKINDKVKTIFLKLDTDGKVYFKYEGKSLGKQYQNDSYVYWGTWKIENSAIDGNRIEMDQDMKNYKRWLHIYFPCSGLIEEMQQYSSLVILMKNGKIYGGRCNTPLQTIKIQ